MSASRLCIGFATKSPRVPTARAGVSSQKLCTTLWMKRTSRLLKSIQLHELPGWHVSLRSLNPKKLWNPRSVGYDGFADKCETKVAPLIDDRCLPRSWHQIPRSQFAALMKHEANAVRLGQPQPISQFSDSISLSLCSQLALGSGVGGFRLCQKSLPCGHARLDASR